MAGTSPVAILHDGYVSVYTVDANGDLQETYLAAMGGAWITQDLSSKYGTPQTVTTPTAVFHDGYTSVYTVDQGGDLQETYLPAIADNWVTQDLTSKYGVPAAKQGPVTSSVNPMAPVALYHTGYTSIYYLGSSSSHVEEAYLPAIGGAWPSPGPVGQVRDASGHPDRLPAGALRRQRRPDLDQPLHRRYEQR